MIVAAYKDRIELANRPRSLGRVERLGREDGIDAHDAAPLRGKLNGGLFLCITDMQLNGSNGVFDGVAELRGRADCAYRAIMTTRIAAS